MIMTAMLGNIMFDLQNLDDLLSSPLIWIGFLFQIWMFVDAIRQREYVWAVFIFLFSFISAILYFFLVYRQSRPATQGFELPGAHDRRRIKELQGQIHHLDKAHHYSELGDIYFEQGKLEDAEKCYREAMQRDAEDLDTQAHLGQCLLRRKHPDEARKLLENVCARDPKHDYGHSLMALAETLTALGETGEAIRIWEQVTENHSYPRARVQLAELYIAQGKPDEARAHLTEVLEDAPHAPAFQRKRERFWVKRASKLIGKI
jgi:hypothetical protein